MILTLSLLMQTEESQVNIFIFDPLTLSFYPVYPVLLPLLLTPSPPLSAPITANISMHLFFTFHSVNLLIQYLYIVSLNQSFYPADNRIFINEVLYFLVNATVEKCY